MKPLLFWVQQVLIAVDQLINAIFGGWCDETLSSRAWRMDRAGKPWGRITRPLIDSLFWFQREHCFNAYQEERKRLQSPPESR